MELQDFVQQTITQIVEATVQSQEKVRYLGGEINPPYKFKPRTTW